MGGVGNMYVTRGQDLCRDVTDISCLWTLSAVCSPIPNPHLGPDAGLFSFLRFFMHHFLCSMTPLHNRISKRCTPPPSGRAHLLCLKLRRRDSQTDLSQSVLSARWITRSLSCVPSEAAGTTEDVKWEDSTLQTPLLRKSRQRRWPVIAVFGTWHGFPAGPLCMFADSFPSVRSLFWGHPALSSPDSLGF